MEQYSGPPRQPSTPQRDNTQTYVRLAEQEARRGKLPGVEEGEKPEGGLRALLRKLWPFGRQ